MLASGASHPLMGMGSRGRWIRVSLVLACAAGVIAAWLVHRVSADPVAVRVTSPLYRDVADLVATNGTVQPISEFQARANFPGIVENVPVELGSKVRPGQMLVTMRDPFAASRVASAISAVASANEADQDIKRGGTQAERNVLHGDLEHAQAARDSAAQALASLQQLQKEGAAAKGEIEAAQKRLNDANITLRTLQQREAHRYSAATATAARDRLADAEAALGAAKMSYANANITSPIAGTVYAISVSPYDFVPMGADLLRVTDLSQMQVRAFFDEPEVGKLKEGQNVTVTWDGRPGLTWHGYIRKAPVAAMTQGSRSVAECLIKLDDSKGQLLPNTHVIVTVSIDSHPHVLTVPRRALLMDGNETVVYRVVDEKLVRTPVRLGLVNLDWAEIASGLSPEDVVAVQSLNEQPLTDNLPVNVVR
jgi:HlyD family secretion protein